MKVALETERLVLRSWTDADVGPYFEHLETPDVLRWLHKPRSKRSVASEIEEFADWEKRRGFTYWALERKSDRVLLGFCGLDRLDYVDKSCPVRNELEIGWRLRADAWGQKIGSEAAEVVMAFAFDVLKARRVVSRTEHGNFGSWKLMQRLGMRHEFALDHGSDGAHRTVVYTIKWKEWRERRGG